MKAPSYERQVQPTVTEAQKPSQQVLSSQMAVKQANQQTGQAMQNIGDMMQKRALEVAQEKSTQRVLDAQTNFQRDLTNLLYNEENGLYSTRSKANAEGLTLDLDKGLMDLEQKHSTALSNDFEKQTFSQLIQKTKPGLIEGATKYELEQRRAGRLDTLQNIKVENLGLVLKNPELIGVLAENQVNATKTVLMQNRISSEDATLQAEKDMGEFYYTAANAYIAKGNYDSAALMLKDGGEYIDKYSLENSARLKATLDKNTSEVVVANINQNISAASTLMKPEDFQKLWQSQSALIDSRIDLSNDLKPFEKKKAYDAMVANQLKSIVEIAKDVPKATSFLNSHIKEMSGDAAAGLKAYLNDKSFDYTADSEFKTELQHYKLADGSLDKGRAFKSLESKYSGEELEKRKSAYEQRASDHEQIRDQGRAAVVNSVSNDISTVKLNGGTYAKAYAILRSQRGGMEEKDYLQTKQWMQSLFDVDENGNPRPKGTKVEGNLTKWTELKYKESQGTLTYDEVSKALDAKEITDGEYKSFTNSAFNLGNKDKKVDMQQKSSFIMQKAVELYPKDKATQKQFIQTFEAATKDMPYMDAMNHVNDKTKDWKPGWFGIGEGSYVTNNDWKKTYNEREDWNNKFTRTRNYLGGGSAQFELALKQTYKSETVDASMVQNYYSEIGGINDANLKAIKTLIGQRVIPTPQAVKEYKASLKASKNKKVPPIDKKVWKDSQERFDY